MGIPAFEAAEASPLIPDWEPYCVLKYWVEIPSTFPNQKER
jgi:hypothetical protein